MQPDSEDTPLVSVVMPAFQPRQKWFSEAVTSVLCDERYPIEVIVVDDGSDPPIDLPVDDPRVFLVRSEHVGTYAARDVGIARARGTYIRFFDADDVSVPGSTTGMVDALAGRTDRIAYGLTLMCDETLVPIRLLQESIEGDVVEACLLGGFETYHVSMLFPAECVRAAGAFDAGFRISGDWDFVLRAIEQLPVVRLGDVVTLYRRSTSSLTGRADRAAGVAARALIVDRFETRHPDQRMLVRRARAATELVVAHAHATSGRPWRAGLHRVRATVMAPDVVINRWRSTRKSALPIQL